MARPDLPAHVEKKEAVLAPASVGEGDAGVLARGAPAPQRLDGGVWAVGLFMLWAFGALLASMRLLAGALCLRWVARQAEIESGAGWQALVDELAGRLRVGRGVRLLRSRRTTMPMTWGILRPVILLPAGVEDWTEGRRRCVLMHEMAHIKRWDCLTQSLAQLACAAQWFNPLVWAAARRLRVEREKACDDLVLSYGARPSRYAMHLLEAARAFRAPRLLPLGAVSMARPSQLESRVRAILDPSLRRRGLGTRAVWGTLALALLVLMPLAALTPWATTTRAGDRAVTVAGVPWAPPTITPDLQPVPARLRKPSPPDTTARTKTVKRLLVALEDPDPAARRDAAYRPGDRGIERAIPPLAEVLSSDPSPRVRRRAAWALDEIAGKPQARDARTDVPRDEDRDALETRASATRDPSAERLRRNRSREARLAYPDGTETFLENVLQQNLEAAIEEAFGADYEAAIDEAFGVDFEAAFDDAFGADFEAAIDEAFGADYEAAIDEAFGEGGLTKAIHALSTRIHGMQKDFDGVFIDELRAIIEEDPGSREAGKAFELLKGIDDPRARHALERLYQ